ncbi:hypothetical protein BdWA1_000793 [Babesia duncani]|uniref:Uncharacterized protein n=1 Tax=Babesia duncani TaxID=323732 RepID=A0AAD9PH23_9APIC|nr:hypothetical protein BdWA1_004161 [Babesia duncani]KAK2197790.1 hypothetical protein BdWA1_000793 [Babesia duncani]
MHSSPLFTVVLSLFSLLWSLESLVGFPFSVVESFKIHNISLVIDTDIRFKRSHDACNESSAFAPGNNLLKKSITIKWDKRSPTRSSRLINLSLPNTACIDYIENFSQWPTLSIDYGSRFIGLSFHYSGESENCKGLINEGNVEKTCEAIWRLLSEKSRKYNLGQSILILVGFPFSKETVTSGSLLFQTIFNLDFTTRLGRFLHAKCTQRFAGFGDLGALSEKFRNSDWYHLENRCIMCTLNLGNCIYNNICMERFKILHACQIGYPVIGVSEAYSTSQTNTIATDIKGRKDSWASQIIYQNFSQELAHGFTPNAMLLVPSLNNIFKSHSKGDCLLLYKGICNALSAQSDSMDPPMN